MDSESINSDDLIKVTVTLKLPQRTTELLEELKEGYRTNSRGRVIEMLLQDLFYETDIQK